MSLKPPAVLLCSGPAPGKRGLPEPRLEEAPACRAPPRTECPPDRLHDGGNLDLMRQVSFSPTEAGAASSSSASSSSPRQCGVRFGNVDVLYHDVRLDDSKLPSDGLAPIGLGQLQVCQRMAPAGVRASLECERRCRLRCCVARLAPESGRTERGQLALALRQAGAQIIARAHLSNLSRLD
jgi:hypothetical protein